MSHAQKSSKADLETIISGPRNLAAWSARTHISQNTKISEVLNLFWGQFHCPICLKLGACPHRDRKEDLEFVLRRKSADG